MADYCIHADLLDSQEMNWLASNDVKLAAEQTSLAGSSMPEEKTILLLVLLTGLKVDSVSIVVEHE